MCFREFSWRGSSTKGGELSSPHLCKLSRATAPSAAGAWTRLKKNIMGIFNFPVWSWEMKSHHERSLPGAASRWECQAQWETTEKYWSSIFIRKEFSSPALAPPGTELEHKMRSPGSYQQDNIWRALFNYSRRAVVAPKLPMFSGSADGCKVGRSVSWSDVASFLKLLLMQPSFCSLYPPSFSGYT